MKIDSKDATQHDAGLRELNMLAENVKNPERERALYYAGYFASKQGDSKKAHAVWTALIQKAESDSSWAAMAKKKLEFLPLTPVKQTRV